MKHLIPLRFLEKGQNFSVCMTVMTLLIFSSAAQALPAGLIPSPPQVAANGYILIDAISGEILAEKNADHKLPPASLTKMMTAYLVTAELANNSITGDDMVTISEKAWRMKGSLMFIEVGEKITVSDLLHGVIIVSGNDASVALSEYLAGSEGAFVQMMNSTAELFGMTNTHFMNASGWPEKNHYSSARDLSLLARHVINDHPEYYSIYAEKEFQYGVNKRTGKPLDSQANRNILLFVNPSVDGIKTGYSNEAGHCLVVSSEREGRRLITVVMGARSERSRASETQKLLTYGFRFFNNVKVKKGGVVLERVRVWKGAKDELPVGLVKDLVVTVPRGKESDVQASMLIDQDIVAPVVTGQKLGVVKVMLDDQIISEAPLVALESIEDGGFFEQLWDSIVHFFIGLFS
ncbi:MAG: D-alanyl-D-alanine carboxypeptidase [Endozoicomonadaceae bacterium]|nr:D-alanyl-D-alanine carboxypeptidase [Endozoicomonadaceae bacterium]